MLLNLEEAAAKLRISTEAVRLEIKAGRIKAMKAGPGRTSPWRISEEALADYITDQTVKANAS